MEKFEFTKEEAQLVYESLLFRELKLCEYARDLNNQNQADIGKPISELAERVQRLRYNMMKQAQ